MFTKLQSDQDRLFFQERLVKTNIIFSRPSPLFFKYHHIINPRPQNTALASQSLLFQTARVNRRVAKYS